MNFPEELKYTKTQEWVRFEDETTAYVGITDYAQDQLGDLVFANLPEAGDDVVAGDPFADVESVKAVSDVISPVTGVVEEVNEDTITEVKYDNEYLEEKTTTFNPNDLKEDTKELDMEKTKEYNFKDLE